MPALQRRASPARAASPGAPARPAWILLDWGSWPPVLRYALYAAPLWSGLLGRAVRGKVWFPDFRAVACGAQRFADGQPLDLPGPCADPQAAAFVYGPWIARIAADLLGLVGPAGLFAAYAALFLAATGFLVWLVVLRRATPGEREPRAAFLSFIIGSAVSTGNVALPAQAAIAAAGLVLRRAPWLLVAAIAAAAAIKPVLLTYVAVIVLMRRSPVFRALACAVAAVAGLAPMALFALHGGPSFEAWRRLLGHFVYQVTPGAGLFGWMGLLDAPAAGPAGALIAMVWAVCVTLCGLGIAERARLGDEARLWIGFACAVLANPRLMSEDLFLLGPGLLASAQAIGTFRPEAGPWARGAVMAACGVALVGNLVDLFSLMTPLATLVLAGVLAGGGLLALQRRGARA